MIDYKAYRIVNGKPRWIIVDKNGNIINSNPTNEEKKGLEKEEPYDKRYRLKYTDKELLDYLIQFYKKYGRPPTEEDFGGNNGYPVWATYRNRFESWTNALKLVKLDVESMVRRGL